ncbi:MAG: DUF1254 domain-containing protein [Candidatus Eremiobacteraeota bacterium]|nr:DUF1254 domain-containing protein [Candidatus Eremiobacteraeota bacterium]
MQTSRRLVVLGMLLSSVFLSVASVVGAARASAALSADQANSLATQAYIYAYPLVLMEITRRVSTNVATAGTTRAPMGQLALMRAYPTAAFEDVVSPNADTLYEFAWMDLSKGPMVLSIPAMGDRYALFPMLSGWTDVFISPGKRTTGTGAQTYAITGPGWTGSLPSGVKQVKSPTAMVWMIGRIYCTGSPEDYAAAHKVQDGMKLVPLSAYGKSYTPPAGTVDPTIDAKTAPVKQVAQMDGVKFFALFASLLKNNPPAAADAPMVAKLAQLGIVPGQKLDTSKLDPTVKAAMEAAPKAAYPQMKAYLPKAGKLISGWSVIIGLGEYGTNYLLRGMVALIGLGANLSKDAVYPALAAPLDGSKNNYVMRFPKGMSPPVNAFWSITLYNTRQFFYDNPLNKYTVSARNKVKYNADGSFDVYIQHKSPGAALQENWLPAPADKFTMIMRLYWPKETPPSVLNGTWDPPAAAPAK